MFAVVSGLFVVAVVVCAIGYRRTVAAVELERADAVLAEEIDELCWRGHESRPDLPDAPARPGGGADRVRRLGAAGDLDPER